MLSRTNRLRRERDIMRVYQKGHGPVTPELAIRMLATDQAHPRVAIVVSKKVDKRAVVRNRNRRRIAGIIAGLGETYLPSCDIVVTVRRDLSDLTHAELTKLVSGLVKRREDV